MDRNQAQRSALTLLIRCGILRKPPSCSGLSFPACDLEGGQPSSPEAGWSDWGCFSGRQCTQALGQPSLSTFFSPDQPAAHPSSTLTPLPSPKQTKLIVSTGAVGAGWSASRRPQAEVPSARAPPDTQGIVLWSTAPGHLSLASGLPPHPSLPATVLRPSQLGAQGSQLTASPPTHTPQQPPVEL